MANTTASWLNYTISPSLVDSLETTQIISAVFMLFLQGGIGLYYSGLSRAKNGLTPLMCIIMNTFLVVGCVWAVGFTFAWTSGNEFIGYKLKWFGSKMDDWDYIPWILHACYTATVVNIACGGIIERGRPVAYFTIAISLAFFIHPVAMHWAWHEEGWLQTVKPSNDQFVSFRDTGGSCIIHVCAGIVGFIGSVLCGNRQERIVTQTSRKVKVLYGHSAPMVGLGGVILYVGLVFLQITRTAMINKINMELLARVVMNILISSLASTTIIFMGACFLNHCNRHSLLERFHWSLINALVNGALVGLVSVAAGCDHYYSYFAFVVGIIGAFVYIFYCLMIHICLVDDPTDTFAVHFGPGFWGLLAVPIFSRTHGAVFFGSNSNTPYLFFAWNLVGGITITGWCAMLSFICLLFLWAIGFLRIPREKEIQGLDESAFQEFAYPIDAWRRSGQEEKKTIHLEEKADTVSHISVGSQKPLQEEYMDTYHHRPDLSEDQKFAPYPYPQYLPLQFYQPEIDAPYWSYSRTLPRGGNWFLGTRPADEPYWSHSMSRANNWYTGPRAKLSYRNPYGSLYKA